MTSASQKQEIRKRMRHIKDAIDDESMTENDVKERTQQLYQYLYENGLVPRE